MRIVAPQEAGEWHGRESRLEAVQFCAHCGVVSDDAPQRICRLCEMGVVLTCAREALGEAFLVVTHDLRVSAASASVEPLLGETELLIGEPLLVVLRASAELGRHVTRAAMGSRRIVTASVQLPSGIRVDARIAGCGPPPAALIVLD